MQNGAQKVYGVDVAYGLVDLKIRNNEKVILIERKNARYLEFANIAEKVDIIVVDVSFISLTLIIPKLIQFCKKETNIILLIKPQFELDRQDIETGGIVRDQKLIEKAVEKIKNFSLELNLQCTGISPSKLKGQKKQNQEYFIWLKN